ncbi:DUF4282 domain-containing protein [Aeromonas caviae]
MLVSVVNRISFWVRNYFGWIGGVTFMKFLMGLLTILGGSIAARIWCELMIVIFKINENLQVLKDSSQKSEA